MRSRISSAACVRSVLADHHVLVLNLTDTRQLTGLMFPPLGGDVIARPAYVRRMIRAGRYKRGPDPAATASAAGTAALRHFRSDR